MRRHGPRPNPVNEHYFDKKNESANMYYVLGALFKCYNPFSNQKKFEIRSSSKTLVEMIQGELGNNSAVFKDSKGRNSYATGITSPKLISKLETLGLIKNKSKRAFPDYVPDEHMHHFIRGYFDVCANVYNSKGPYTAVYFSGNKKFLEKLSRKLESLAGTRKKTPLQNMFWGSYKLTYSHEDSMKIYNYIYKDNGIHLPEKKDRFNTDLVLTRPKPPIASSYITDINKVKLMIASGLDTKDIAEKLGYKTENRSLHFCKAFKREAGIGFRAWKQSDEYKKMRAEYLAKQDKKGRPGKKVNLHYFDKGNESANMYYVLGAMFKCCTFFGETGVGFANNSKMLIDMINNELDSEYTPWGGKRNNSHWVRITYASDLRSRLEKLGITGNKEERVFPSYVPKKYISDFIRGFSDACVYVAIGDHVETGFNFYKKFLEGLSTKLHQLAGTKAMNPRKAKGKKRGKKSYYLCYHKKDTIKIINFLYEKVGLFVSEVKEKFNFDLTIGTSTKPTLIESMLSHVKQQLARGINGDQIAGEVGYQGRCRSESLYRAFKCETGMGINEWKQTTEYRIMMAKELLAQGIPTGTVAWEVGYRTDNRLQSFCSSFREHTGYSVREWRKTDEYKRMRERYDKPTTANITCTSALERRKKVEESKLLLAQGAIPKKAAFDVGYKGENAMRILYNSFKAVTGMTIGQWMETDEYSQMRAQALAKNL